MLHLPRTRHSCTGRRYGPYQTEGIPAARMGALDVAAAVVTGCAAAWAGHTTGFEAVPTVLVGLLAGATVRGTYRRRLRTR
jgi:hypothetical protein